MTTVIFGIVPALITIGAISFVQWIRVMLAQWGEAGSNALRRVASWMGTHGSKPSFATGDGLPAWAAAIAIILILLIALGKFIVPSLNLDGPAGEFQGLLFIDATASDICEMSDGVARDVLSQDRDKLLKWFQGYAEHLGVAVGIGVTARQSLLEPGRRVWLLFAGLAAFLGLVGALAGFGVLGLQAVAPRVTITPEQTDVTSGLRLLSREPDGILVWLEERREVRWIRGKQIQSLTVGPAEKIVDFPCPTTERGN